MSSLLQEAIVDAKALRETALKNAEAAIVEKYSGEVRETLEQLLEQEDDLFSDAPPANKQRNKSFPSRMISSSRL